MDRFQLYRYTARIRKAYSVKGWRFWIDVIVGVWIRLRRLDRFPEILVLFWAEQKNNNEIWIHTIIYQVSCPQCILNFLDLRVLHWFEGFESRWRCNRQWARPLLDPREGGTKSMWELREWMSHLIDLPIIVSCKSSSFCQQKSTFRTEDAALGSDSDKSSASEKITGRAHMQGPYALPFSRVKSTKHNLQIHNMKGISANSRKASVRLPFPEMGPADSALIWSRQTL